MSNLLHFVQSMFLGFDLKNYISYYHVRINVILEIRSFLWDLSLRKLVYVDAHLTLETRPNDWI